ncbi:MAG: prolyl oligopeptidase family serine peptidase [Myxococcales bacterium]|nr:prolyl oligopeptidase family serine peptidase [Myxococcales bacterium]
MRWAGWLVLVSLVASSAAAGVPEEAFAELAALSAPRPGWRVVEAVAVSEGGLAWERVRLAAFERGSGATLAEGVVWVLRPPGATRFALGLPGWRLPAMGLEREGDVGAHAMDRGIALVLAEMGTSVYEAAVYPEARRDRIWCGAGCRMGGLAWVRDVVLPYAEARLGRFAGAFGLSTGGRGALAVAQWARPGARVCAASGTFDLMGLAEGSGEYRIHANALGERAAQGARWAAHDNRLHAARAAGAAVLLLHGKADRVVPAAQSVLMGDALRGAGASATVELARGAGHDWGYWRGAMGRCVGFVAEGAE